VAAAANWQAPAPGAANLICGAAYLISDLEFLYNVEFAAAAGDLGGNMTSFQLTSRFFVCI
jgi:hypothetical protein